MILLGSIQRTELEQLIRNQLSEENRTQYLHSKLAEATRTLHYPLDISLAEVVNKDILEAEKQVSRSFHHKAANKSRA